MPRSTEIHHGSILEIYFCMAWRVDGIKKVGRETVIALIIIIDLERSPLTALFNITCVYIERRKL